MYHLFEISGISIVQADFGVNIGSVVRRRVKFVGCPMLQGVFPPFVFALSFSSKTERCLMHLHNEIPALLSFCVDVPKCRSCSD